MFLQKKEGGDVWSAQEIAPTPHSHSHFHTMKLNINNQIKARDIGLLAFWGKLKYILQQTYFCFTEKNSADGLTKTKAFFVSCYYSLVSHGGKYLRLQKWSGWPGFCFHARCVCIQECLCEWRWSPCSRGLVVLSCPPLNSMRQRFGQRPRTGVWGVVLLCSSLARAPTLPDITSAGETHSTVRVWACVLH